MEIKKEVDPERYGVWFPENKETILFQLEMENPSTLENDWIVIGRVKDSKKPAGKLRIMWTGQVDDFLIEFAGDTVKNEESMNTAITRFIFEKYLNK